MKRLIDIIRFSIISPEFLVMLLILMFNYFYPEFFTLIGKKLNENDELWKYIPTLPVLFCGITFRISAKLNAPLENTSNKKLYEWASFHQITDRIMASYFICIICCICAFLIWFFMKELGLNLVGMLLLGASIISGLTAFQIFIASQKIRQIIELDT